MNEIIIKQCIQVADDIYFFKCDIAYCGSLNKIHTILIFKCVVQEKSMLLS